MFLYQMKNGLSSHRGKVVARFIIFIFTLVELFELWEARALAMVVVMPVLLVEVVVEVVVVVEVGGILLKGGLKSAKLNRVDVTLLFIGVAIKCIGRMLSWRRCSMFTRGGDPETAATATTEDVGEAKENEEGEGEEEEGGGGEWTLTWLNLLLLLPPPFLAAVVLVV